MLQHGIILLLIGPLIPSLMDTFHIDEGTVGLLLAMGSTGFLMGPLVAGLIIDRISIRWALIVGVVIEIVFLLLFGLSNAFFIAVIANFALHLGSGFVETSANVLPSLIEGKHSAHARMNAVHLFFSVGAFLAPFLIGLYLDATGQFRPVFFFALIPTAVLLTWSVFVKTPDNKQSSRHRNVKKDISAVLKSRTTILGALSLLLYVGAEVGVSSWIVHYLQEVLAFSTVRAASGLSLVWVFIMIGRYLNSLLGRRLSAKTLVVLSGTGGFVGVILFVFIRSTPIVYILLAWIGICLSGVFPNIMAELNGRDPKRIGTVTAVMAMGAAIGAGIFQWLIGIIAENVSLRAAYVVPGILQLLAVVSFLLALMPENTNRRRVR